MTKSLFCPFSIDQLVIAELRNQIVTLKAQQRDQIEQLKHERESWLLSHLFFFFLSRWNFFFA